MISALRGRSRGHVALWSVLLALGETAALALTRAGTGVAYQHLRTPLEWTAADALPLLALAVQALLVALALGDLPRRALAWLRARYPGWRFLTILALFAVTAATLSADPRVYAIELLLAAAVQTLMLFTVLLAARALPDAARAAWSARIDRWLGAPLPPDDRGPARPDRFAWGAALWAFAVAAILAIFVYGAHPHVPDEVAYLMHARYFAEGQLWMDAPPVEPAFRLGLMAIEDGRWYSPVPPAWPAVLAVGVRLGAAHLVNPVLAAINVLLAHALLGHLFGRRTARLGTALLAVSPWFLFLAMSYMTHMLSMLAALGAACCVARMRAGGPAWWLLPGGLAIGVVGLTRPLEGLIVAGLLGFWLLGAPRLALAGRLVRLGGLAVATIATAAVTFPYNRLFTGDPLTFPLIAYTDAVYGPGTNALGFGSNRGLGWSGLDPLPGHGPLDVLINGNINLFGVNVELLAWAGGSLLVVLLGALAARRSRADRWLVIAAATVVVAHCFYWFSGGPDFGARYWFLILLPCIALAARGLEAVSDGLAGPGDGAGRPASSRNESPHGSGGRSGGDPRPYAAAFLLSAITVAVFVPWRSADKYHDYRGMRPDVRRLAAEADFGRSLVLVRGRHFPDYASAAVYNPLDLSAPAPIYAYDAGPRTRAALARAFPDRPVWILEGPGRTDGGFRVADGPLPPGSAPADPLGDVDPFEDRPGPGLSSGGEGGQ